MKKTFLASAVLVAVALTGCSSSSGTPAPAKSASPEVSATPTESAAPLTGTDDVPASPSERTASTAWAFATGYTFGKFEIPGEPMDDFLDIMKRYDEEGAKEATFISVKVDNRESDEEVWVREARGYDADGNEYKFIDPVELLDMMFEEDDSKMDYDDEYMKYFDEFQETASPGEVHEFQLITFDELPEDGFRRVMVDTGNLNEVEAVPMEEAESQGYPLDF